MNTPATGFNVSISNLYTEDQKLYASIDPLWDDSDGVGIILYQWQRSDGQGGWINIVGATSTFYSLTDADVGYQVRVQAYYVDGGGTTETTYSSASQIVINVNDSPTGAPLITGLLIEGAQAHAATGTLADADGLPDSSTFSYQWQRSTDGGQSWQNIAGAQDEAYTLTSADSLQLVRVAVSYTDLHGTTETAYSAASEPEGALQLLQEVREPANEFKVNTYTELGQGEPSVTALTDGGWVVTWTSNNVQDGGLGIYGQRYDGAGFAVGVEFKINTYSNPYYSRSSSSVTALADGGWVVTWVSQVQDGSYLGIYGQRYDRLGASVGSEFRVNYHTLYNQSEPSLTALIDGGWIVTWTSNHDGSLSDIYSQRYDSAGVTLGSEFRVNTYATGIQEISAVTALADGGWVVVWSTNVQADGSTWELHSQRYTKEGNLIGTEFTVNTQALPSPVYSSVAALADGGWVVTWEAGELSSGYGIYGQRYESSGAAAGIEFHVNTYTAENQTEPSVTALTDGGWVVTWVSQGQDGSAYLGGIYGQRYDSTGAAVGAEFQVNTYTTNSQANPSVTALADGGWVVTWMSNDQDGSSGGIYSQRYDANGNRSYTHLVDQSDFNLIVGRDIYIDTTSIADSEGSGQVVWQWQRSADAGSTWSDISGANANHYTLAEADAAKILRLKLAYTDSQGKETIVYSELSNLVTHAPIDFVATITGTVAEDSILTANASVASDADGLPDPLSFTYQWQSSSDYGTAGTPDGGTWTNIAGATSAQFAPGDREVGKQLRVVVHYVDGQNTVETTYSAVTSVVSNVNDVPTGFTVIVAGNKVEDQTLTSTIGTIVDPDGIGALSYQWQRTNDQGGWSDISGATSDSYMLDDADVGHQVRLKAFYVDGYGTLESAFSAPTKFITGVNDAPVGVMSLIQQGSGSAGELRFNSFSQGAQAAPSITTLTDGSFVATWLSNDGSGYGIYGQRYSRTGEPIGPEFRVNTYTANNQIETSVEAKADGGFVVTWTSFGQDGSSYGIYGQRYDSSGNAAGVEFKVNTFTTEWQEDASLATLVDGGFVVTWTSAFQDGWGDGIYGQRYDSTGSAVGLEFRVNTTTTDEQYYSSVASLNDGGFVVTWYSQGQDGSGGGIFGQRYSNAGMPVGSEFQVNTYTTNNQIYPGVTALADGGFVVTWTSVGQDGSGQGVYAQRYDSTGSAVGLEFRVNTTTTDEQYYSSAAALNDGGFVVTWYSNADESIFGQRFSKMGSPIGGEFQINTSAALESYATVTGGADGGFIVTWSGYYDQSHSDIDVYARHFFDFTEGKVLTADPSQISDIDGLGEFSWQWQRSTDGGTTWTDIAGASGSSYTLGNDDAGALVRTVASYIDGQGFSNIVYSEATTAIVGVNDAPIVANAIADQSTAEDTAWAYQVPDGTFVDVDNPTLTYSAALGNGDPLPTWLSFDGNTQTFSGTPPQNFAGDLSLTVTASDGSLSVSDMFVLSVKAVNDAPTGAIRMLSSKEQVISDPAPEFRINTTTADDQINPSVTALIDGGWVVTWTSSGQDTSGFGIYGQRYDKTGAALGDEFRVNTFATSDQFYPEVIALADGGWVVTWTSWAQDGSEGGIYSQRYDSTGDEVGSEFRVNSYTASDQAYPKATALADGGWVLVWYSTGQDGSGRGIFGQRFASDGSLATEEFQINTQTTGDQTAASIACLSDGGWIVAWMSWNEEGTNSDIYGQRYDSNGAKVSSEFKANTYATDNQFSPTVAALADGGWIIVWISFPDQDGSGYGIYGQRYDSSGAAVSPEFQVNTYVADNQSNPSITALTDGGWVVTWDSWNQDGYYNGVYVKRYDSLGNEVGTELQVNSYTTNDQGNSSVSALLDGGFIVTWKSYGQDGSNHGIYGQRFDAQGNTAYTYLAPGPEASSSDFTEDNILFADASLISDPDGMGTVSWQWQRSSDGGATWTNISGATGDSYTLGDADVGNLIRLRGTYIDGQSFTNTVYSEASSAIINVNDAPVVANTITDQSSPENAAWMYQLPAGTFSDVDGDSLTYSATLGNGDPLPDWLTFTVASRTFSGTPPQDFNGDITLRVTASDGTLSASDTFVLTIEPPLQFVTGTAGNDTLTGVAGSVSEITGGVGNDTISGGNRADVAVYSGNRSDYTITTVAGVTTVVDKRAGSPDGTDTLKGLNILRFADIQLFQTTAANKMTLAGQAQTYNVSNSEVVQGTNAAEHFIIAPRTSALVFAGNNDVVDLSGAIDSYTFSKTGTQLQISDGIYTSTISVGGTVTLRTASGSTSVAIDYSQGGAIKLGGTQIVGSASFDPLAAILDAGNIPSPVPLGSLQTVTGTSGNDTLTGIAGSVSKITGGAGNDTITGGSRADVAVFSGNRSDYTITTVAGVTTVVDNRAGSPDGTDTLRGLNILRFADLQLFQTAAANKVTLAGQAQTYEVVNSEVVQGTNAAEHFIVAPKTSALVFAGNNDVIDLAGAIDSYTFTKTGTQLQISDGLFTTTISVGGTVTLRTASGSTSVAIDYSQGGAIKLGGTQIVGSASFDALDAITDHSNFSDNAVFGDVNVTDGHTYYARAGEADVFLVDAAQALTATIVGFEAGDRIVFENRTIIDGAAFDQGTINDGIATIAAGSATITLDSLANDNFGDEVSFENIYGANAIGYVI